MIHRRHFLNNKDFAPEGRWLTTCKFFSPASDFVVILMESSVNLRSRYRMSPSGLSLWYAAKARQDSLFRGL